MTIHASVLGMLCALALLPATAQAQQIPKRHTVLGAEYGIESLDNNSPDWTSAALSVARFGTLRRALNAEWRRVERFDLSDSQFAIGGYAPMTSQIGLTLDASAGQGHGLLAKNSFSAELDLRLGESWVAHLGGKQSHFREEDTTVARAGLEFYRGAWRLAYTLVHGRLQSGDYGNSHIAQCDWYYGDANRVGLLLAGGGEATRIDPNTVIVTDVRSAALTGRHWLAPAWGLSYALGWTEQGDFYTREGGSLGLLFRF